MPNLNLPTNITPGVTPTFEADVEAAWTELNEVSRATGIRDITSLLINGWTASTVRTRRTRNETIWEFFNLDGSAATSSTLLDLSDTSTLRLFRPAANYETAMFRDRNGAATGYYRVGPTAITMPVGYRAPASTIHEVRHRCSAVWPTEFPGTPVAG